MSTTCYSLALRSGLQRLYAFLWPPNAVKVTKGAQNVATYAKTELSQRKFCRLCGGHLMAAHPPLGMTDVFVATIPDLPFIPQVPSTSNRIA